MLNIEHTLLHALGIEVVSATKESVIGHMPVDNRTVQPMGLLHGGATAALIETMCSIGSMKQLEGTNQHPVGIEINVNHIRGIKEGKVFCTAVPVHLGNRLHVWNAEVRDEIDNLIATGRLTVMVVNPR